MAETFLTEDFLLTNEPARTLYHNYAAGMPIFDYHCHLSPREIAENRRFENLTQIWLAGDHYKWRLMRANGIPERLITGDAPDWEKFEAWAATVPRIVGNPIYHWTHMELKRPFGLADRLLSPSTAREIYEHCSKLLEGEDFRARGILKQFAVRVVCTTDDPADDLAAHRAVAADDSFQIKVLPTFRPDKALAVEDPQAFNSYVERLEERTGISIRNYASLVEALRQRHDEFHRVGCRISDHGLGEPYAEEFTESELRLIFDKLRIGKAPDRLEARKLKSALMLQFGEMNAEKGWTMQLHLGALRNVSSRLFRLVGPDAGGDTIGDFNLAVPLARFLDRLDGAGKLPKVILYNLNPRDNELLAAMAGCFQDGSVPGKVQFGAAWWFNDHKAGIEAQLTALANIGILSRFVGMLTDSRSFLSYVRHEYFRRILCDFFGREVEEGRLPGDLNFLGGIVKDICYRNAVSYFGIDLPE